MGSFFSDAAIPMGMLFLAVPLIGFLRRKAGNVVARGLYPGLAEKLGLSYEPSAYRNGVGRLVGDYQGYRVTVDPDDQRRIFLRFETSPPVELHSYAHNKRSGQGQRSFRPVSRVLSQQFKTAHAAPALIEALNDDDELAEAVRPLKFIREIKTLSVTSSGVTVVFDYGNPPYIPAGIVEDVLPRLLALARVVEPAEPSKGGEVPPHKHSAGGEVSPPNGSGSDEQMAQAGEAARPVRLPSSS